MSGYKRLLHVELKKNNTKNEKSKLEPAHVLDVCGGMFDAPADLICKDPVRDNFLIVIGTVHI